MAYLHRIDDPGPPIGGADEAWRWTPAMLEVIASASSGARKRALNAAERIEWSSLSDGALEAIVASSSGGSDASILEGGGDAWRTEIDLEGRRIDCECPAFKYNAGPCKHLVGLAVAAVADAEGGSRRTWRKRAMILSRNRSRNASKELGDMRRPDHHDIDEAEARAHGTEVRTKAIGASEVRGYDAPTDNGSIWTGPLPVPEPGERIAWSVGGDVERGEVVEWCDADADFFGLRAQPDGAEEGETVLVFGQDLVEASTDR